MKTCNSPRSALLILVVLLAALPSAAQTKDEKKAEAQLRIVHGLVGDKDENPVPSSVVYLLNVKTQAVKTSFADDKGQYRFSGLDPNVDYEIHAEHDDFTCLYARLEFAVRAHCQTMLVKLDRAFHLPIDGEVFAAEDLAFDHH